MLPEIANSRFNKFFFQESKEFLKYGAVEMVDIDPSRPIHIKEAFRTFFRNQNAALGLLSAA